MAGKSSRPEVYATDYDAYGQELYGTGSDRGGSLRFAGGHGYQTDDASGMQLLGARYYVPALGRFLTQDPIGHEGGLNLYAYCENSPLMRVDPDGLDFRNLQGSKRKEVWRAISRIYDNGFKTEATYLTQMVKRNRVNVQAGRQDQYTGGNRFFEGTLTEAITRETTISPSENLIGGKDPVQMEGSLFHELTHVAQNSVPFGVQLGTTGLSVGPGRQPLRRPRFRAGCLRGRTPLPPPCAGTQRGQQERA